MTILDTNVLSELMRPEPSIQVIAWMARQPAKELCTTAITEAEIFYGIQLLHQGQRRNGLLTAAEAIFAEGLAGKVIGFDREAARIFAEVVARRRALGKPINHPDGQIASIARMCGARLATRNRADFEECGVEIVDPWNGS